MCQSAFVFRSYVDDTADGEPDEKDLRSATRNYYPTNEPESNTLCNGFRNCVRNIFEKLFKVSFETEKK